MYIRTFTELAKQLPRSQTCALGETNTSSIQPIVSGALSKTRTK